MADRDALLAADEAAEALIHQKAEELNAAVRAANARGLRVSLGLAAHTGRPSEHVASYDLVRVWNVERPRSWRTGKLYPAPEGEIDG